MYLSCCGYLGLFKHLMMYYFCLLFNYSFLFVILIFFIWAVLRPNWLN